MIKPAESAQFWCWKIIQLAAQGLMRTQYQQQPKCMKKKWHDPRHQLWNGIDTSPPAPSIICGTNPSRNLG